MSQPIPSLTTDWNNLFNLSLTIVIVAAVIVLGAMLVFCIKYREKKGQPKFIPQIGLSRSRAREAVIFASISIILLISLTVASYRLTPNARFPPSISESLVIDVTAYQWNFRFTYPNGAQTTGECYVPANQSIVFNVTSSDVMHNFGLMDFRVKTDAIPGRYNVLGVTTPPLVGNSQLQYTIRCYELCGSVHAYMMAPLIVMDPTDFTLWLNSQTVANATLRVG